MAILGIPGYPWLSLGISVYPWVSLATRKSPLGVEYRAADAVANLQFLATLIVKLRVHINFHVACLVIEPQTSAVVRKNSVHATRVLFRFIVDVRVQPYNWLIHSVHHVDLHAWPMAPGPCPLAITPGAPR